MAIKQYDNGYSEWPDDMQERICRAWVDTVKLDYSIDKSTQEVVIQSVAGADSLSLNLVLGTDSKKPVKVSPPNQDAGAMCCFNFCMGMECKCNEGN